MAEQKSFWKRYQILIVAVITILLIYLITIFSQKIDFLLGNEMIIYLTPQQKSFNMHYGDVSKIEFNVSIGNAAYCKAACSYSFSDRSRSEIIDKGSFEIEKNRRLTKNYDLSVKRLGSGQDIYSFDVMCSSIRSFLCLTEGINASRSSLIIVNYDLTETEKELKQVLKHNVTDLLELLAEVDVLHQQVNQKYFELGSRFNLINLSKQKTEINDIYFSIRISIENLQSLWAVENYIELSRLFNESFFKNLSGIKAEAENLNKSIDKIAELHNSLLYDLSELSGNLRSLEIFANMINDSGLSSNAGVNIEEFNKISSSIANNTFNDYSSLTGKISNLTERQKSITEKSKIQAAKLFFDFAYRQMHENDLLCSLRQDCKDISINNTIKIAEEFSKKYPNAAMLNQICSSLKDLNITYLNIRNESLTMIYDKNIIFPSDIETLAGSFADNEKRNINNSYIDSFEKIVQENKTDLAVIKTANLTLPAYKSDIMPLSYNESINISLYLLSKINLSGETLALIKKCPELEQPSRINIFDFAPVNASVDYKIASRISTNLSDNPPICCVFNQCKPCCSGESCRNDPKTFPIIFLHGHSVTRSNSPEFSLDAFNKFQLKLQEDGYLNAGILLYSGEEDDKKGEWGLSGKPVTVKVTYYYDVYRNKDKYAVVPTKSESIDTYALRLNDIINVVKERTGKPKVNIIAFSMGGLVSRKYLQIFGGSSVDKLITIGSPHQGVIGKVAEICPLIGENKECADMQKDSLFLNKLNDPAKQPSNVKIYNIFGKGCLRNGFDGDGIVFSEQASLNGIAQNKEFIVNGTCSGSLAYFHTDLLDIDKYPKVYEYAVDVLKE